ncbi:hypothetical protein [Teredinibacter sp. KSP-S5-2]|uniref:hypothetical protein n=1 Tax=Teredinibacter sp. KSP-S5-2 TaxID=3034506 RepID=UPI002934C1B2|nr:hypothetical protein [Teredinibacter sp. KSP-S5-2]WNO08381.1 hypothetical protein P5V12_15535 [Teredinibacter sp. KSP-S5-2]
MQRGVKAVLFFLFIWALLSCSTFSPEYKKKSSRYGFTEHDVNGAQFEHRIYRNHVPVDNWLNVYIEGDGQPILQKKYIAHDPTSRTLLMMDMMALDKSAALYLGRPCYMGKAYAEECTNQYWTIHRYSPAVVDSMVAAVRQFTTPGLKLRLIGHSGGGVLAVLMAEQLPEVQAVVTIAAPLDIAAWTRLHHYTPLVGSLNPSLREPLLSSITQLHLSGGMDKNVPAWIVDSFTRRQKNAVHNSYPDNSHICCWASVWLQILDNLPQ